MSDMIHPWGDYVAVTDPPAETQDGTYKGTGIHVPEGYGLDILQRGIVLAVGPAVESPEGFTAGALIYYQHGHGLALGVNETIKMIPARGIVCWEAC